MVRDRLNELKQRAEQSRILPRNNRAEESKILPRNNDVAIELDDDHLKNVFSSAKQIEEGIEKISRNIELSRSYLKQISEFPFREKDLSDKLTEVFQQNGKLTQNLNTKLQQFEVYVKNVNKTCTVGRIEMIQYNTLKTRFHKCIKSNNEEMENFKNFRIHTYKAQLGAKGMNVTEEEFSELLSGDQQLQIFTDNLLIETAEARRLLCEAEELNEQLLKIEQLLSEVRDLFVQMSVLVDEQQELIDVVEFQAQKAVEFVGKTPVILREAEKKKLKAAKMKYLCFGIIAIVLVLVALSLIYG